MVLKVGEGAPVDCILPHLVVFVVAASNVVVHYGVLLHTAQLLVRVLVSISILARRAHLCHVHQVLSIRILLRLQRQVLEFFPHWRVLLLLNLAEGAAKTAS